MCLAHDSPTIPLSRPVKREYPMAPNLLHVVSCLTDVNGVMGIAKEYAYVLLGLHFRLEFACICLFDHRSAPVRKWKVRFIEWLVLLVVLEVTIHRREERVLVPSSR